MVLFLAADGVPLLMAARALQGLATGAAIGTLTATVIDTQPSPRLGSAISGAGPSAGLAAGVLVAGILVEYASVPRFLIYELILAAYAVLLIVLLIVPRPRSSGVHLPPPRAAHGGAECVAARGGAPRILAGRTGFRGDLVAGRSVPVA